MLMAPHVKNCQHLRQLTLNSIFQQVLDTNFGPENLYGPLVKFHFQQQISNIRGKISKGANWLTNAMKFVKGKLL
jgi:hypothetical protein